MPKSLQTPDRLFDRTWRPGHPFRPRISGLRRWGMGCFFVLLCVIIGGYWFYTDAGRVGRMAETYLSTLLGGRVRVGSANLSIFEGLKLDDVKLYADDSDEPDALMFSAKSFLIQYSPRELLTGKIEATRIVAIDPRVRVTEDAGTGRRNYSRLLESHSAPSMPAAPVGKQVMLPEIVLRNAQLEYTRLQNGQVIESSSIGVEGSVVPMTESGVYAFRFQSRNRTAGIGPMVNGQIMMGTGQVTASLQNFEFGADVKNMLPPDVRRWWEQHELTGRVSVPVLSYVPPARAGESPGYRVELELQGVTLVVHPDEWMGDEEHRKLDDLHSAFDAMRIAGLDAHGVISHLAEMVEPQPVNLKQVHGRFIFNADQSIQIEDLNGWLEEVAFKITGRIKGYTPAAEAQIRIASSDLHDIEIPAAPRYINSLPPAVREIYDRFKPRGICRFWVNLNRPAPGARPRVTGQIDIVDGNFVFDQFPYPLRKATGQIVLNYDPQSSEESLRLVRIRGRGIENGPNANSFVEINGSIGPFGPDAHVDVVIAAQGVSSEPALMAAFPAVTRKALTVFDAPGKGEFPKFTGDFACNVVRVRGPESNWIIDTNIHLDDASGSLVSFPYPMTGVTGDLRVHDDSIELANVSMKRGDASLKIDGRISWPHGAEGAPSDHLPIVLKPNLRISARDVALDRDLLNALPAARREWLVKTGVAGTIQLDGTIKPGTTPGNDIDIDLDMTLRDGTLLPQEGGGFAATSVGGNLRLTNNRLVINDIRGKRGEADLSARGEISWAGESPRVVMRAEARELTMDQGLYKLLPPAARQGWDEVRPDGTLDATLNYSGVTSTSTTSPDAGLAGGYEIVLTPRRLGAMPRAVPYRLEQLTGSITIVPDKVILKDMVARHGATKLRLSGTGISGPQDVWDFTLGAEDMPVDDDLRRAVPGALADMLQSIQMRGKVSFEFSKLRVVTNNSSGSTSRMNGNLPASAPDMEFALRLTTAGGSVDVGVPLSEVRGTIEATGASRNGKLWALNGRMDCDSLILSGRPLTRFHADFVKPAGQDHLTIDRIEAGLARGGLAGTVDLGFGNTGPTRYAVNLALRNADVREITGDMEQQDLQGRLSASLAIEGIADQPNSRRGRGIVEINGDNMYRIPLVLGLLQITNLSLPITSPFTQATARYILDGNKVTFEQIELRSKEMLMTGTGNLDFASKQVQMTFSTDSTTWPKLPFIGEFIEGARHELLQIRVRGTLQEPKVSARAMNTLSTTVDEVLRGGEVPGAQKKR